MSVSKGVTMKKLTLLIITIFLLTACNIDYKFSYKEGIFSEEAVFTVPKEAGNPSIEDNYGPIDGDSFKQGNQHYKGDYRIEGTNEVLDLSFKYDKISFEKSKMFSCFENATFEEKDDYYAIRLSGNTAMCPYIKDVKVTFESDMKVLSSNASSKDDKNGIYKWDNPREGIDLQISKTFKLGQRDSGTLPIRLVIIGVTIALCAAFVFLRKRANND